MLRMEIALFLVVAFVAYMYFSAEKERTALHRTFSVLLVTVLIHLVLDGSTVYTVNHLDTVPELFNDILHRLFLGSMVVVIFLFYQYIAILVQEETGKGRRLDWPARIFLILLHGDSGGQLLLRAVYVCPLRRRSILPAALRWTFHCELETA